MSEDQITIYKHGTSIVGPDSMEYFRVKTLWAALGLMEKGIKPNRWMTQRQALDMAGKRVGKVYKRGQLAQARTDLKIWLDVAISSLTIIRKD